jgi:hypothetical protein
MPYYADCYVLVTHRSPRFVERLIAEFLPDGALEAADEYEIPQDADQPAQVFTKANDLAEFLENHPEETQTIYWHSTAPGDHTHANVHYIDGGMILGIGIPAGTNEDEILESLKRTFDTELGAAQIFFCKSV